MGQSRGARLSSAIEALGKLHGKEPAHAPGKEALDHLVYGILAGNGPASRARDAFSAVGEAFVDRNELRVAADAEITPHLGSVEPEEERGRRANLLRRALQGLFDTRDRVRMEFETEDDTARVVRALSSVEGLSPGLVAAVVARARPDPPIRGNPAMLRTAQRIGVVPSGGEKAQAEALVRALGPDDGLRVLAHYLFTEHGETYCLPRAPRCGECPCLGFCDYGRRHRPAGTPAGKD